MKGLAISAMSSIIVPVLIFAVILVMIIGWTTPGSARQHDFGIVSATNVSYTDCNQWEAQYGNLLRPNANADTRDLDDEVKFNLEDGISKYNVQLAEYSNEGDIQRPYKFGEDIVGEFVPLLSDTFEPRFTSTVVPDAQDVPIQEAEGEKENIGKQTDQDGSEPSVVFSPRDIQIESKIEPTDIDMASGADIKVDVFALFKAPEMPAEDEKSDGGDDQEELGKEGKEEEKPPLLEARAPELLTTLKGTLGQIWTGVVRYGDNYKAFDDVNFLGIYAAATATKEAADVNTNHINVKMLTRIGLSDEQTEAIITPEGYTNQKQDYLIEHTYNKNATDNPKYNPSRDPTNRPENWVGERLWQKTTPIYAPNFYEESPPVDPQNPPASDETPVEPPAEDGAPNAPFGEESVPVKPSLQRTVVPHDLRLNMRLLVQQFVTLESQRDFYASIPDMQLYVNLIKHYKAEDGESKQKAISFLPLVLPKATLTADQIAPFSKINEDFGQINFYTEDNIRSIIIPYFVFKDDVENGTLEGFSAEIGLSTLFFPDAKRAINAEASFGLSDGLGTVDKPPTNASALGKRFPFELAADRLIEHRYTNYDGTFNTHRSPYAPQGQQSFHEINEWRAFRTWAEGVRYNPDFGNADLNDIPERDIQVNIENASSSSEMDVEIRFYDANNKRVYPKDKGLGALKTTLAKAGKPTDGQKDAVIWTIAKKDLFDKIGAKTIAVAALSKSHFRNTHIMYYYGIADAETKTTLRMEQGFIAPWPDNVSIDYPKVKTSPLLNFPNDERVKQNEVVSTNVIPGTNVVYEFRILASTEAIARAAYPPGHNFLAPEDGNYEDTEKGEVDPLYGDDTSGEEDSDHTIVGEDPDDKASEIQDKSVIFQICPASYQATGEGMSSGLSGWLAWAANQENWKSTTDGGKPGIDVDGAYGAQCADLSKSWAQWALGLKTPPLLTAVDGFMGSPVSGGANFPPPGIEQRNMGENDETIQAGDIVFFKFGHTAVVTAAQDPSGLFRVFEQNPGSPAEREYPIETVLSVWKVHEKDSKQLVE